MKHKLAAATLLAMINIPHAIAADLPSRNEAYAPAAMEAPVRGYNWNGFYAGVNVGYGWGSFSKGASNLFKSPTGAVLGGQAGFNYQTGSLVTGLEGDLYWSGMSSRRNLAGPISSKGEINWAGSLRARAGFAAERVLVYLTGGVAMGKLSARINDNLIPGIFSSSDTRIGWVGAMLDFG
ncbi:MAG: outer membrane beta-barrel protein [Beijerinckiaceae bacterium]|nr:outer membrane beta-barrel protein [Beijerinckiaceae bacterium]